MWEVADYTDKEDNIRAPNQYPVRQDPGTKWE